MSGKQIGSRRFAIAVSFPGEHRRFVLNVVNRLAKELGRDRVFYDEWYEDELVGVDGDLKLRRYYREQSEIVVPFFSEHYRKPWCEIEWHAVRAMLKDRRAEDAVLPVEMDGTQIEGWESVDIGIRRKNRTGIQIAELILAAVRKRSPAVVESGTHGTANPVNDEFRNHVSNDDTTANQSVARPKKLNVETSAHGKAATPVVDNTYARNQEGLKKLKLVAIDILESELTRKFILKNNALPHDMSAVSLAAKLFEFPTATPKLLLNSKYDTPMDYLYQCIDHDHSIPSKQFSSLGQDMLRLAAVMAPVSFVVDDSDKVGLHVNHQSSHANVSTPHATVAMSAAALFLGVSVDFEYHEPVRIDSDEWHFVTALEKGRNRIGGVAPLPELGIESPGIVDVVSKGLAAPLDAIDCQVESVQAALRLRNKHNCFVCLLLTEKLSDDQFSLVNRKFPELILLVSEGSRDSVLNKQVLTQIRELRAFFGSGGSKG